VERGELSQPDFRTEDRSASRGSANGPAPGAACRPTA
jgi:hypothetical protein